MEKLAKLESYFLKITKDIAKKEGYRQNLKKEIKDKNYQLREMYRLECDIGFEEASRLKIENLNLRQENKYLMNKVDDVLLTVNVKN